MFTHHHIKKIRRFTGISIGLGLLLSGCQTVVPEKTPALSVVPPKKQVPVTLNKTVPVERYSWVSSFGDSNLSSLVDEAVKNSPDLKLALARMEGASFSARMAKANLLPTVSMDARGSLRELNGGSFDAFKEDEYSLTFGTSWELDLWGKVRSESSASFLEYEASGFDFEQAKHSVAAQVCSAWFDVVAAAQQLKLAEQTYESYQSTADLIKNRYESGIDSALDYRLALANAESAKSSVARRSELLKRTQRSLQLLIGRYPDGLIHAAADFPVIEGYLPSGIPSDLLSRRPDIRAAERRLASAESLVNNASKQRFPSIQLTGSAGTQSPDFKNLMDGNYDFWQYGASVSQTIFDSGRLNANKKRAEASLRQVKALYEQAALRAFNEVEQAIDADRFYADLETSAMASAEQSMEAEALARDQYTAGLTNIVTVLEAQRRALIANQSYIDARNSRIQNRIQLYLALGGQF